jgi:segregation and condensation protein A
MAATLDGLAGYQLRLTGYEGPLDVLLRLTEQRQLDISTVSLLQVTSGFLDHLKGLAYADPRLVAEFAAVAARLLVLKSRALLPFDKPDEEEEIDDLVEQLEQYRLAKQRAAMLREIDRSTWRSFSRPPSPAQRPLAVRLELPPIERLTLLLGRCLARRPDAPTTPIPGRQRVTVRAMMGRLRDRLTRTTGRYTFREFVQYQDRSTVIAGFLAVLTLRRRRQVVVVQDGLFAEIELEASGLLFVDMIEDQVA